MAKTLDEILAKYPDMEQLEIIRSKCREAGMKASAIDREPFEAFARREFTNLEDTGPNSLGEWLCHQKGDDTRPGLRPHLFTDFTGGQFDLERQGFLNGNITARAKLVNLIGEADANARAQDWGLDNIADFRRGKAKEPDSATVAVNDQRRKLEKQIARDTAALASINKATPDPDKAAVSSANNPWAKGPSFNVTEQGRIVKRLGIDKARQIARAAGVVPNF